MIRWLVVLFVLLLAAAGGGAWWLHDRWSEPYRGFGGSDVFVELPEGASVNAIARRLADAGVIADPWSFRLAVRVKGADRRLQAGEYRFADEASVYAVIDRLARGDTYTHPVTFPEGLTVAEMAVVFERTGLGTAAEFERAAASPARRPAADPETRSLEGYLFPDTYRLARRAAAAELVRAMVGRFDAAFSEELRAEAARQGLTPRDVVTLASVVEKETARDEERALVAAVYRNRLARGMPLQCDPTVIYALMLEGRWSGNLRRADLEIDSPYNTYRYAGLPPGPIASPGRASIEAALRPADVPYLYFVSRNDGTHVFASTLAEHNRNVREWQVLYFRRQGP
jgi:UPF0755 protein